MPGPFPGMDPYIEARGFWGGFHNTFLVYTSEFLNAALPPEYVADVEEWLLVTPPDRRIRPDVSVADAPPGRLPGGAAILEKPQTAGDAPWVVETTEEAPRSLFVNIYRVRDESEVIATLELLSHANKTRGKDRQDYLRKQRAVYASDTHLIEIDLLRAGAHTLAVPLERLGGADYEYLACLHRGRTGPRFELWPGALRDRLPRIAVPLEPGVADVELDLQAVFDRTYESGAYARKLDYSKEPDPPLSAEDAAWADALLREKGLRP